ncbi:MAG TPA: hypothetical protein VMZ03_14050 [Chitinophagaceae bacterium]|nr:hypothetical protein [Chitinophagaceae bacterium]
MRPLILLLIIAISPIVRAAIPVEKVLVVKVDEIGLVSVGRDNVGADNLAKYIQERLFKSYMGTGQMHDRIRLEKIDSEIPEPVITVVIAEIKAGQHKALTELCLQKFSKTFEELDSKKQGRLKKQFPVLFQSDFS